MPVEHVLAFTALSERALLYMPDGFEHKILSMAEASDSEEQRFQDYLMRTLMSEKKLRYHVPVKTDGGIETILIEKEGPVTFLVTTTKNKLHPENETRMLSLELDDSAHATKNAMKMIARVHGLNKRDDDDFGPWRDFQRWLAAGEKRVVVEFAPELSELIPPTAVRVRRDLLQLIGAIKAHALLHREARERLATGEIVATVEQDYAAVRGLMAGIMAVAVEAKISKVVRAAVEAVESIEAGKAEAGKQNDTSGVTVLEVAHKLKIERGTARRRLNVADDLGLVVNLETRPRRHGRYKMADAAPADAKDTEMLPSVEALRAAYDAALAGEGEHA